MGNPESVSVWIQRIQKLGSKFREAALQDCEQDERVGILTLADKLRNNCFVQGLYSDRIQTIVRSRNHSSFDDIAETALEEESAIFSKNERYKNSNAESPKCSNCNKLGHVASRCYLKDRKDTRVNQLSVKNESRETDSDIICYNCQGKGHIARHCRKPKKHFERQGLIKERNGNNNHSEKQVSTIGEQQPTDGPVYSIGCIGNENLEFLRLRVYISKENELLFLIDTGADISIVKGTKLIGTTVYNPNRKVQVKCVDGSPMETHGVLEARIELKNSLLVHNFQLLNKQVDIPCDGILGRDFLQLAKAKLCYESRTVTEWGGMPNGRQDEATGVKQTNCEENGSD